jgi:ABC-2 type transport system ATP-binding protein
LKNEVTIEIAAENNDILRGVLNEANFISKIETKSNLLIINVKEGFSVLDVSQLMYQKGIILIHLNERKRKLEEEFLQITARAA